MVFIVLGAVKAAKHARLEYVKGKKRNNVIAPVAGSHDMMADRPATATSSSASASAPAIQAPTDWWGTSRPLVSTAAALDPPSHGAPGAWSRDRALDHLADDHAIVSPPSTAVSTASSAGVPVVTDHHTLQEPALPIPAPAPSPTSSSPSLAAPSSPPPSLPEACAEAGKPTRQRKSCVAGSFEEACRDLRVHASLPSQPSLTAKSFSSPAIHVPVDVATESALARRAVKPRRGRPPRSAGEGGMDATGVCEQMRVETVSALGAVGTRKKSGGRRPARGEPVKESGNMVGNDVKTFCSVEQTHGGHSSMYAAGSMKKRTSLR